MTPYSHRLLAQPCPPALIQEILARPSGKIVKCEVTTQLVSAMNLARGRCKAIYAEAGCESSDVILATLRENLNELSLLDKDWAVEAAMIENVAGTGAEPRLLESVLAAMGTRDKPVSPEAARTAIP